MSTWRSKAIELFPDLRREFEKPDTTIYGVFFELLLRVRDAHKRQDVAELGRIYGYAAWCFDQKAEVLENAAAVAFYEHLVDDRLTLQEIPRWIRPDHFENLKSLFEWRLPEAQFLELCKEYAKQHGLSVPDKVSRANARSPDIRNGKHRLPRNRPHTSSIPTKRSRH